MAEYANDPAGAASISYEVISQTHQDYCADTIGEYWALYKGGKQLLNDKRMLSRLLPRQVGEHQRRYSERLDGATYVNHFGKIVGFFCSAIFQQEVQVLVDNSPDETDDYYERFQKNADGAGNSLTFSLRKALVSAMVLRRGVLVIDFPREGSMANSELDQREKGGAALPYLVHRDTADLINWKKKIDGTFEWCVFRRHLVRQRSPLTKPQLVEEFKIWTMGDSGKAAWAIYESPPMDMSGGRPVASFDKQSSVVKFVDGGETSFKRIPVMCLEIEEDLWVGDRVAPIAREHFQRRTALRMAIAKHLFSIPYVKLGADIPEVGGSIQSTPTDGSNLRSSLEGKGFVVLGENDEVGFAEPTGAAYELEAKLEQELTDEMYRVGEQMSNSIAMTQSGVYRSGISKAEDRYGTELVLETYSARARAFAVSILEVIAEARGDVGLEWKARGAEDFTLWDRNTTLGEAVNVDKVSIPSKTFHVGYKTQVASRLLKDPKPEDVAKIREELEKNIEENGVPDPRQERIEQQELAAKQASQQREKGPITSGQLKGDATKVSKTSVSAPKVTT